MEYKVRNSEELPNNSMKLINVQGSDILLCRSDERLYALNNCCPHRGASLSKSDIKGTKIICYMHDFEYDLNDGKLLHVPNKWKEQNPNWTKSGNLLLFSVSEKDGEIYVRL